MEECAVCGKNVAEASGFTSSTGIIVCGDACKESYTEEHAKKPKLTVYSRVTGYCTPVSSWNKGKLKEWHDRQKYSV